MSLLRFYRHPGLTHTQLSSLLASARAQVTDAIEVIDSEYCFNVETDRPLEQAEERVLRWLLTETFQPEGLGPSTFLGTSAQVFEVGPRMSFTTAWATNAVSICAACGLTSIRRIE